MISSLISTNIKKYSLHKFTLIYGKYFKLFPSLHFCFHFKAFFTSRDENVTEENLRKFLVAILNACWKADTQSTVNLFSFYSHFHSHVVHISFQIFLHEVILCCLFCCYCTLTMLIPIRARSRHEFYIWSRVDSTRIRALMPTNEMELCKIQEKYSVYLILEYLKMRIQVKCMEWMEEEKSLVIKFYHGCFQSVVTYSGDFMQHIFQYAFIF